MGSAARAGEGSRPSWSRRRRSPRTPGSAPPATSSGPMGVPEVAPPIHVATTPPDASATLVWLAYTSTLARAGHAPSRRPRSPRSRAGSIRCHAGAPHATPQARHVALAGRGARRRASGVGSRRPCSTPARCSGTANALRLSQIVEGLHGACARLPPPEALSAGARSQTPLLLVVDDDDALARGAAHRGRGARLAGQGHPPPQARRSTTSRT